MRRNVERHDANDADDQTEKRIFEPELQIAQRRNGDGRGQWSNSLCDGYDRDVMPAAQLCRQANVAGISPLPCKGCISDRPPIFGMMPSRMMRARNGRLVESAKSPKPRAR
jgi:hypothetical protein